jgi:hypothetical protein
MATPGGEPELLPVTADKTVPDSSPQDEADMLGGSHLHERFPNSIFLPIGRRGHISWHSESSASVLALIMLFVLLATVVLLSIIAAFSGGTWSEKILELLGQAVTAVVGAVVGASAAGSARNRRR